MFTNLKITLAKLHISKKTISIFTDKYSEELCFPEIYVGTGRKSNDERKTPLNYSDIIEALSNSNIANNVSKRENYKSVSHLESERNNISNLISLTTGETVAELFIDLETFTFVDPSEYSISLRLNSFK